MKRFITLLLIAAVIALSLTACDSSNYSDNDNGNDSIKEIDAFESADPNQGDTGDYTNDLKWEGVYGHTEDYMNGWFIEITNYDGGGFRFKIYDKENEYDKEHPYLDGEAVICPDNPYNAEYTSITFSINADSSEITVDGSDYGVADGIYARYGDGDLAEK